MFHSPSFMRGQQQQQQQFYHPAADRVRLLPDHESITFQQMLQQPQCFQQVTSLRQHCSAIPQSVTDQLDRPLSAQDSNASSASSSGSVDLDPYNDDGQRQSVLPVVVEDYIVDDDDIASAQQQQPSSAKMLKLRDARHHGGSSSKSRSTGHQTTTHRSHQKHPVDAPSCDVGLAWSSPAAELPQLVPGSIDAMSSLLYSPTVDASSIGCCSRDDDQGDIEDKSKRERKRERNKLAARKCRARKLDQISTLQAQCDQLREKNDDLFNTSKTLHRQVTLLRQAVEQHIQSGCCIQPLW